MGNSADVAPAATRFVTPHPAADVRQILASAVRERGGKVHSDSGTRVVASFGSGAKVRLLGGAFIDKLNFPREAAFSLESLPDGTSVTIVVRETLGFGSRAGMREKLDAVLREDIAFFEGKFPERASSGWPIP